MRRTNRFLLTRALHQVGIGYWAAQPVRQGWDWKARIDESRRRQGTKAQSFIPIYVWTDPHSSCDLDPKFSLASGPIFVRSESADPSFDRGGWATSGSPALPPLGGIHLTV